MKEFMLKFKTTVLIMTLLCLSIRSLAQANSGSNSTSQKSAPQKSEAVKVDPKATEDGYIATSSTHIDFSETSIDGKMKAPDGFMLQGRQGNSLSQMVKLRSNFRNELNNSKSATKALVK